MSICTDRSLPRVPVSGRSAGQEALFNGEIVTSPRSQVYFIVTEYGAVNLEGRSTWERAEMIISLAHPDFRDDLVRAAEKQKIWVRSNRR